jgi:hypothetical protein
MTTDQINDLWERREIGAFEQRLMLDIVMKKMNIDEARGYCESKGAIAVDYATHSKFRKSCLQETGHRIHVTYAKVCMLKPDSHCGPPIWPHSRSRGPFKKSPLRHRRITRYICKRLSRPRHSACIVGQREGDSVRLFYRNL